MAYKFAEQNRDAISRVADELVERRELNGDEITELHELAAPEARASSTTWRSARGHACDHRSRRARRRRCRRCTAGASRCSTSGSPRCSPCGAAIGVHLATRTIVKPKPWASWVPLETTPEAKVREIADHVQNLYVGPSGKELTTVRGGPLSVGSDPAVLVKPDASATATGGYKFFDGPSVEYQICGNTTKGNCAIDQKKITPNQSGALTRRMAYELALMTFHYVPEVQERGRAAAGRDQGAEGAHARARARRQQGSEVARGRRSSRSRTKDGKNVGLPNSEQATNIAKVTDPLIFHYEVTATSDNQPVYLITPLLISDTAAGKARRP